MIVGGPFSPPAPYKQPGGFDPSWLLLDPSMQVPAPQQGGALPAAMPGAPVAPPMQKPYDYGMGAPVGYPARAAPQGALPQPPAPKPAPNKARGEAAAKAIEDQGLDLNKVAQDAAARAGAPPDYVSRLSRADKGEMLLELGLRMMALSGRPGANTAASFGEAAIGAREAVRGHAKEEFAAERLARDDRQKAIDREIDLAVKGEDMKNRRALLAIQKRNAERAARPRPQYFYGQHGALGEVYPGGDVRWVNDPRGMPFRPAKQQDPRALADLTLKWYKQLSEDMMTTYPEYGGKTFADLAPEQQQAVISSKAGSASAGGGGMPAPIGLNPANGSPAFMDPDTGDLLEYYEGS